MIIKATAPSGGVYATHGFSITDPNGTGLLPAQLAFDDGVSGTVRGLGPVHPSIPWAELKAATSAPFLESMSFVPYLALDVVSIDGAVDGKGITLAVAEA